VNAGCSVAASISGISVVGNSAILSFAGTCDAAEPMTIDVLATQIEDQYGNLGSTDTLGIAYTWTTSFMFSSMEASAEMSFVPRARIYRDPNGTQKGWLLEIESDEEDETETIQLSVNDIKGVLSDAVTLEEDFSGALWIVPEAPGQKVIGFDPSVLTSGATLNTRWPSWILRYEDYFKMKSTLMGK
jgi:hypothetical protein